jgi:hypothetical protein
MKKFMEVSVFQLKFSIIERFMDRKKENQRAARFVRIRFMIKYIYGKKNRKFKAFAT